MAPWITLLTLILPLISARLLSPHASQTSKAADASGLLSGWVPKPTAAPTWQYGYEPKHALLARQESLTCGFFDGDPSSPNLCGTNSACIFYNANNYFGCCENGGSCANPDYCEAWAGDSAGGAQIVDDFVSCGSNAPYCQTTYFPYVAGVPGGDTGPFVHYDCVTNANSYALYLSQDTTSGYQTYQSAETTSDGYYSTNPIVTVTEPGTTVSVVVPVSSSSVTVTQPGETISVIVPVTMSMSSSSPTVSTSSSNPSDVSSAGVLASGQVNPTATGGAAHAAQQTAGVGVLALVLAAGQALL